MNRRAWMLSKLYLVHLRRSASARGRSSLVRSTHTRTWRCNTWINESKKTAHLQSAKNNQQVVNQRRKDKKQQHQSKPPKQEWANRKLGTTTTTPTWKPEQKRSTVRSWRQGEKSSIKWIKIWKHARQSVIVKSRRLWPPKWLHLWKWASRKQRSFRFR